MRVNGPGSLNPRSMVKAHSPPVLASAIQVYSVPLLVEIEEGLRASRDRKGEYKRLAASSTDRYGEADDTLQRLLQPAPHTVSQRLNPD